MDKMLATTHAGKSYLYISLTISAVWTTCPVSADDPPYRPWLFRGVCHGARAVLCQVYLQCIVITAVVTCNYSLPFSVTCNLYYVICKP